MEATVLEQGVSWSSLKCTGEEGIIVGTDGRLEWLLPWWWEHYSKHNTRPVAFLNFGMSKEKKNWCRERGRLIEVPIYDEIAAPKEEISTEYVAQWEEQEGRQFWECRSAWFKKPFACILSPFKKTVWVDLDCEIRDDISPLFSMNGLALNKREDQTTLGIQEYSSGVISFSWGDPLIEKWANRSLHESAAFRGDQELLSWIIHEEKSVIHLIEERYNWSRTKGDVPGIIIYHWHGEKGRAYIAHELWKKSLKP